MSGESAPYAQFLEQLPATIDRLAASAGGETEVHLPLKLDLLPAMLQYLLSTGQMSTDHVAYQSLERLCLLALNKDRMTPANRFAPLLEFATAQRNMFGAGCAHFMHGQGLADGATAEDPASFFALHNSGQHHADTIAANMPPADVPDAGHLHSLLNFFAAARAEALDAVFCPARDRVVILAFLAFDGLMLGAGAMVDEARERVVGFKRPIEHEEAEKLLSGFVDDTAMQRVLATNPLLTEVSEYIITTSDAAVSGHLGFSAYAAEGDHRDVLARLHRLVKATRICRGCLLDAWVDGMTPDKAAAALERAALACDAFCIECEAEGGCGHHREPNARRRCSCCVEKGCDCETIELLGGVSDCCGAHAKLFRLSSEGNRVESRLPRPSHGSRRETSSPLAASSQQRMILALSRVSAFASRSCLSASYSASVAARLCLRLKSLRSPIWRASQRARRLRKNDELETRVRRPAEIGRGERQPPGDM